MSLTVTPARRGRDGQTLVIFAIFLVVLLGAAAITIDYGSWLKAKRDYQNVVDAAVLQGAVYLTRPVDAAKQRAALEATWASIEQSLGIPLDEAALALAGNTPPTPGEQIGDYRVWVRTPPITDAKYAGAYANNNRVVYASIEKFNAAFFSRIFGQGERSVQAWASAGTFPNRFAVITLRKNGDPTNGNPTDLDISGNNTVLRVSDGDVGGNWGMSINGVGARLIVESSTPSSDAYGVYLTENVPTGGNGWMASQVVDGTGTAIPVGFHAEVADPNYPAPCLTYGLGPGNGCLEDRSTLVLSGGANLLNATPDRAGDTCPAGATVARLAGGRYDNVRVPLNKCILLDPTHLQVPGKQNGIYYFTGTLDLNNSALMIGDGVTVVFDRNADLNMNADASISLNSGNTTNNPLATLCGGTPSGGVTNCRFSAWAAKAGGGGTLSWGTGVSTTYSTPADPFERGIAAYVCKSAADCDSGGGPSTNIFQVQSGSGVDYRGLVYAPFDNVKLAGQPTHRDIGQLVSWTAQFTGGAEIRQGYDGPDSGVPQLLEPRVGQ